MTDLILQGNAEALTMSSREIAEVVESRHDNVKRTMETLRSRGLIAFTQTEEKTGGRSAAIYWVAKRDSYVVVAQLSPEFTARLVDRWQELESKAREPSWLSNISPQARIAIEDLNNQLVELSSQIDHLENLFTEGMSPAQFVKGLNGVNCMAINQVLAERKWLFREGGHWRVASYARDRYLTEQQTQITPRDAEPFVQYKPVLLRKGAAALYKLYLARQLVMKKGWKGEFTHDKSIGVAA